MSDQPVVQGCLHDQLRLVAAGLSSGVGLVGLLSENLAADPRGAQVPALADQLVDMSLQLIETTRRLQDLLDAGDNDRPHQTMPLSTLSTERPMVDALPIAETDGPEVLWAGDLCIEPASRIVLAGTERVVLSLSELTILTLLAASPNRMVPHHRLTQALRDVDGHSWSVSSLYHLVARLRSHIDLDRRRGVSHIQNVRGAGYQFIGYPGERLRPLRG